MDVVPLGGVSRIEGAAVQRDKKVDSFAQHIQASENILEGTTIANGNHDNQQ